MPEAPKAPKITRGYAITPKDDERLKAAGVKTIYRAWLGEVPGKFRLRSGETLGVVNGLRTFGKTRAEMVAAAKLLKSWGASIVDVTTGENSREDGMEMLHRALTPDSMMTPERARAMQAASAKKRTNGRASAGDALRAWRNPAIADLEAFREATGWPPSTAYLKFGPRFAVVKRPRKQK